LASELCKKFDAIAIETLNLDGNLTNVSAECLANLFLIRGKLHTDLKLHEKARVDYDTARELNKDLKLKPVTLPKHYTKFFDSEAYSPFFEMLVSEEIGDAEHMDRIKRLTL
jgi:hypothetical protein